MKENDKSLLRFFWIWDHLPAMLITLLVIAGLVTAAVVVLENRIQDIESRINFAPPRSYEPPNLDNFSAGDVTAEQLVTHRDVYVPVYSHIYYQGGSAYPLETTLSIRNIDTQSPVFVESVKYFDTTGDLAKTQVDQMIKLKPLETIEFLIERQDSSGGSGANFLVRWGALENVNKPLIETVMVGTLGTQGIGFSGVGIEMTEGTTGGG